MKLVLVSLDKVLDATMLANVALLPGWVDAEPD